MGKYGEEIDSFAEGQIFGDVGLLLNQPCVVNAVAATNCSIINIGRDALMSLLGSHPDIIADLTKLLNDLKQCRKSKIQYLRIHQSISCGKVWLAHMGGEQLKKPHDYGHRREFLVMGKSILETAEALQEAEVGTLVVSKSAWHRVSNEYETMLTPLGNYKILGRMSQKKPNSQSDDGSAPSDRLVAENVWGHHMKRDASFTQKPISDQSPEQTGRGWTLLRCYCHEGARDLQEIASFAADVRKMTVMFVLLDLNLEDVTLITVRQAHEALLIIQRAAYNRNGTLRQFIQDDKGLLAICIMGFPPFSPHENDATRAVLVGMEIRESLREKFSMKVSIGITTGTGYSGFVGSSKGVGRREMCAMGSIVNMAARLMCKAGEGILVDRETRDLSTLMVVFLDHEPIRVKGRDEPLEVFKPLARNSQDQVRDSALVHIRRVLSSKRCFNTEVKKIAEKVLHYFDEVLSMGDECSWHSLKGVCYNLFDNQHIAITEDSLVVSSQDLRNLSKIGLTRAQLLSRGCFEDLSPPVPIHVQMLAKIVCFLSHETFVSLSLARHVYCSSFKNFEGLFNESMAQLETYGIIKPAGLEDISESMLSIEDNDHHVGCRACLAQWGWVTPAMRDSLHAHIFNFKTRKNAHISAETIMRSAGNSFSESFSNFLSTKEGDCNLHQVFVITRAELVRRLNEGLLETYKRLWHRYAAEYFDDTLPLQRPSSQIILAHHWTAAVDYESPDPVNVKKAVLVLQLAANSAIEHNAYYEAMEYLQRACRLLDRIPMQANVTEKKLELLAEMAPFTIHVYGHGSVESMSAYSGLQKRIPKSIILDDAAVQVLAGLCINLYGKNLFEVGYRVAQRIITSAKKSCNQEHLNIGFASIVPWHYHVGEFDIVNVYVQKLYEGLDSYKGGTRQQRLVNGVYYGLVISSVWPTVLLIQGKVMRAVEVMQDIMAKAEACAHPPSQCYVLANLGEFFAFFGDAAKCEELSLRAVRLAERYRLAHCRRRASGVLAWVTSQGIREHLNYLQELSSGVSSGPARPRGDGPDALRGSAVVAVAAAATTADEAPMRRALSGRAGLRDMGNQAMHASVFGCSQSNSLLHLQSLAFRGNWAELEVQMAGTISAAVKSGTYLLPELLRLNCAVLLATGQDNERESASSKHARVRECFARCADIGSKRNLALFYLLGATDWLCFERSQCQAAGRSASDTLLLALKHVEQALEALVDGDQLPLVGVARNLAAQYNSEVRSAVKCQVIMGELLEHYDAKVADNLFEMLGSWTGQPASVPASPALSRSPRSHQTPGNSRAPAAAADTTVASAGSGHSMGARAGLGSGTGADSTGIGVDVAVELEAELAELRCILRRPEVAACLADSERWGQDPFALHRATGQRSLQALVLHALEYHGCMDALRLDAARVARFMKEIARGMPDNPYHNAVHCTSVVQGMHALMASGGVGEMLGPEERLAGLVAAAVHDFEHQGLNNDVLVRMGHEWALDYNDTSPNENHHVAAAFKLLRRPDCSFMAELPAAAQARVRQLVIRQVLATDMKEHPRYVAALNAAADAVAATAANGGVAEPFRPKDPEAVALTLCAAIKVGRAASTVGAAQRDWCRAGLVRLRCRCARVSAV
jgi:class 3 adenylate cyclase